MPVAAITLKQFALFKSLPDDITLRLCQHASLAEVPKRKVVVEKGQVANALGLLLDGRLQGIDMTLDGREAGLYFIEPNDFFGELSVIDRLPAPEYVISLSAARFIKIPAVDIQQVIRQSADVASIMNSRLSRRLREAIAQRTLLAMPTPIQRIAAQLLHIAIRNSKGKDTAYVISHAPTHQELAIMINATRETVTRAFQMLQKNKIIQRNGNQLVLHNYDYLKRLAEGEKEPKKAD